MTNGLVAVSEIVGTD